MRKKSTGWIAIGALFLVGFGVTGCLMDGETAGSAQDTTRQDLPAYGVIGPDDAAAVLQALSDAEDFVLLDIRTQPEIEASHIAGAQMLDYYAPTFRDALAQLDRDITYLIYCRTGNRTGKTMTLMKELGFTRVYDLGGGITQWAAQGYPVATGPI